MPNKMRKTVINGSDSAVERFVTLVVITSEEIPQASD